MPANVIVLLMSPWTYNRKIINYACEGGGRVWVMFWTLNFLFLDLPKKEGLVMSQGVEPCHKEGLVLSQGGEPCHKEGLVLSQ